MTAKNFNLFLFHFILFYFTKIISISLIESLENFYKSYALNIVLVYGRLTFAFTAVHLIVPPMASHRDLFPSEQMGQVPGPPV